MVDALASGASEHYARGGSSPLIRTKQKAPILWGFLLGLTTRGKNFLNKVSRCRVARTRTDACIEHAAAEKGEARQSSHPHTIHETCYNTVMLHYVDEGSGPVIVALHGMAGSLRYWEALSADLSKEHRLIRLDLLGFGHSPASKKGYRPVDHVRAIEETLQRLGVTEAFTLVGHSMGALIALNYATTHPKRLQDLVLISMPIYSSAAQAREDITKSKKRYRYAYYGRGSKLLCTVWCRWLRPISRNIAPLYLRNQPRHVAQDSVLHSWRAYSESMRDVIEQQQVTSDIQELRVPARLVYGASDSEIVLANAKALRLNPRTTLTLLPGGHNIPLEHPQIITHLILEQA